VTQSEEVRAGSLFDLRGEGQLLTKVGSIPVVVFWHDGRAWAIEDRCPHMGFPLHQGTVEAGLLTCHWHHAQFDLESGCTLDLWADDARGFDVRIAMNDVFVAARPVQDPVGHLRQRLRDGLDFDSYFKASDALNLADSTEISLVQVNPRTGRRGVWPNTGPDFAAEVSGLSPEDGAEILEGLFEHCTQDRFVYRHEWQVGDACLWINTQTMHEREAFPDDQERVLRHVSILGVTDPLQRV